MSSKKLQVANFQPATKSVIPAPLPSNSNISTSEATTNPKAAKNLQLLLTRAHVQAASDHSSDHLLSIMPLKELTGGPKVSWLGRV